MICSFGVFSGVCTYLQSVTDGGDLDTESNAPSNCVMDEILVSLWSCWIGTRICLAYITGPPTRHILCTIGSDEDVHIKVSEEGRWSERYGFLVLVFCFVSISIHHGIVIISRVFFRSKVQYNNALCF